MSDSSMSDRRLSVNAPFMKDIKDDNRELKRLHDEIQPLIEHVEKAVNHWAEVVLLVGELRDQLAFHFSLEEAYGYFDEAIETEPQMSVRAEALRGEHSHLFNELCQLAEAFTDLEPSDHDRVEEAVESLMAFQAKFQHHEEAELKLILAAMDDDLGVAD